jgi:CheY-like chemotaxis protein
MQTQDETVEICFTDSGRGISQDFLKNNLFKVFSQQDPLDSGLGLGLTLVQGAVRDLKGRISFDSDESKGTEVRVTLPRQSLAPARYDSPGHGPGNPERWKLQAGPLPITDVQLFIPTQWREASDPRNGRSLREMTDSLDRIFYSWFGVRLRLWEKGIEEAKILLVLDTDLKHASESLQNAFRNKWKLVLCPDARPLSEASKIGIASSVPGLVTPYKLQAALSACHALESQQPFGAISSGVTDHESLDKSNSPAAGLATMDHNSFEAVLPIRPATRDADESSQRIPMNAERGREPQQRDPRFLLVDDNVINLKVLAMFAKKCSKAPFVLASSGQHAIDAFKATQACVDGSLESQPFDIIFLDLSMPEISGFEVASTIRSTELAAEGRSRVYIAALTGLISEKDRGAAFAAGVDEYITKPATLRNLQSVIEKWRKAVGPAS